jgi:ABC-type Fe3+-hydroxamate transport system substrate-binding protein
VSTADALTAYTEIATVLGQPKAAGEMIDRVTREIAAHPIARADGGPLHLALVASRKPLRVVGKDAFLSHLLQTAGVENVFAAEAGVTVAIQPDQLDSRRPDRVVDLAPGTLAGVWVDPAGAVAAVLRSLQQ